MRKIRDCVGIDISKDVFDVIDEKGHHHVFSNDYEGFKSFKKILTIKMIKVFLALNQGPPRLPPNGI